MVPDELLLLLLLLIVDDEEAGEDEDDDDDGDNPSACHRVMAPLLTTVLSLTAGDTTIGAT
jgi:hypothetical protein